MVNAYPSCSERVTKWQAGKRGIIRVLKNKGITASKWGIVMASQGKPSFLDKWEEMAIK